MDGSTSHGRSYGRLRRSSAPVDSLGADVLCIIFSLLDHFDIVRCAAVCKSWNNVVFKSTMMKEFYQKYNPHLKEDLAKADIQESSFKKCLEEIAMDEHRLSFQSSYARVHQWSGHEARVNLCRMKRGVVLTGVGDKVLKLWSVRNCSYLDEYALPDNNSQLLDYDFDENKIVGLASSGVCIWRRQAQKAAVQLREGNFARGLCIGYTDPEAVVGCEDGRARVFDMYSGRCSRIIRMHSGPVSCLTFTDDQLVLGGSTFGNVSIADLHSGDILGSLKSSFSPTGFVRCIKSLTHNSSSYLVFAGSSSGYVHCWDMRTLRPLWETRVSPNVIYTVHHMANDLSTLAVGGLDGVLRSLCQSTGEVVGSFVTSSHKTVRIHSKHSQPEVFEKRARSFPRDTPLDAIPRQLRPPITCIAVGMKKAITVHNEKFIRIWRFQ